MKKSTNFFNCAAKAASKTGGGDSQKNVHHLGVASEMPPRCLRDASVSIYSRQSDFSSRVWKYVAMILMVFTLGVGQMWGAESATNDPATVSYGTGGAAKTFLNVANTVSNCTISSGSVACVTYGLYEMDQNWKPAFYSGPKNGTSSSRDYSGAAAVGFLPGSSAGSGTAANKSATSGYGAAKYKSSAQAVIYVTGITGIAVMGKDADTKNEKRLYIKVEEYAADGTCTAVGTGEGITKSSYSTSLHITTFDAGTLSGTKYYKVTLYAGYDTNHETSQIRFTKYIAPSCEEPATALSLSSDANATVYVDDVITFSTTGGNGGTVTIAGANSETISENKWTATEGEHTFTASQAKNGNYCAQEDVLVLTVNQKTPVTSAVISSDAADKDHVVKGSTVNLTCTAANATTWQWYLGDDPISGATSSTYSVTANTVGTFAYKVAASNSFNTDPVVSSAYSITVEQNYDIHGLKSEFAVPTAVLNLPTFASNTWNSNIDHGYVQNSNTYTISAYAAYQSASTQTWVAVSAGGSSEATWDATGVFAGSTAYMTTNASRCADTRWGDNKRSYSFRVKNATNASVLVNPNGNTGRKIYFEAYEVEANATTLGNLVEQQVLTTNAVSTLSLPLNKDKEYVLVVVNSLGSGARFYELALTFPPVAVTGVTLNKSSLTLPNLSASEQLTATVLPATATNKNVTWSIDPEDYATVTNGLVEAVAAGEAVVTVTTQDGGFTATCNVTVEAGLSDDATLSDLTVGGETVDGFAAATEEYDVVLPFGTTAVPTVAGTANDANAKSVVVTQASALPGSATVVVTAEDNSTKTYTVNFTLEASKLLDLVWKTGQSACEGAGSQAAVIKSNNAAVSPYIKEITFENVEGSGDDAAEGGSLNTGKKTGNTIIIQTKPGYLFTTMSFYGKIETADAKCLISIDGGENWSDLASTSGDDATYCDVVSGASTNDIRIKSAGIKGTWIRNMQLTITTGCSPVKLNWTAEPAATYEVGKAASAIAATANNGGAVAYSTTASGIVEVAANGALTIAGLGSATLKAATAEGDGTAYCANGGADIVISKAVNTYYLVKFNAQNETAVNEVKYYSGDDAIATPVQPSYSGFVFQGWFDAASAGNAVAFPLTPESSRTIYAQWVAECTGPTINVHPASANYLTGRIASALACEATAGNGGELTYTWYSCDNAERTNPVALAGAPTPSTAVAGTFYYYCAVTEAGCDIIRNSDVATITVEDKEPVCIIKSSPTSENDASVDGYYKGSAFFKGSNAKKLSSGYDYVGVQLMAGKSFLATDKVVLNQAADLGSASDITKFYVFTETPASGKSYATVDNATPKKGDNWFAMPAELVGESSLYIGRVDSKCNPTLGYLAVYRVMMPELMAIKIDGRDGEIDALNDKHFNVTIPHEAVLTSLTVVPTIVRNAAHATTPEAVISNEGAWELGDNTYRVMDKDGDYTDYTITLTRDVLKHTVSFNTHGGTSVASVEVVDGGYLAAAPTAPTKEDYIFQYWSESDGGAEIDVTTVQVNDDVEFHAVWASDGGIKLLNGTTVNTTNYITGVTASKVTISEVEYDCVAFAGTVSNVNASNMKNLNSHVTYNATTTQTKIMLSLYNSNGSNKRTIYVKGVVEGTDDIVDLAAIELNGGEKKTTEYIEFNNAKNRSIYIFVSSNAGDIKILQAKVIESGSALKMAGESGYSLNMNKGRMFGAKDATISFEGMTYTLNGDYTPLSSEVLKVKSNSIVFEATAPTLMKVTTANNNTYYVTKGSAGTDNETAKTGVSEFDLTAGTWYITAGGSEVQFTKIEFIAPKCEQPTVADMSDVELCEGVAFTELAVSASVSDEGTLHYAWYKVGETDEAVGDDEATYTPEEDGEYYVIVTNRKDNFTDNSKTSNIISVAHFAAAVITTAPEDVTKEVGQEATLTVVASGKNCTYEWFTCDDAEGTNPVAFEPAETGTSLTVTVAAGEQFYKVVVSSDCGEPVSAVAKVAEWREVPQANVTGTITWDWTNSAWPVGKEISFRTQDGDMTLLANENSLVPCSDGENGFRADMLLGSGQHIWRTGGADKQCFQGNELKFHTTVAGKVTVWYRSTGSGKDITLNINGIAAGHHSTTTYTASETIVVPANSDVRITKTGETYVRINKIVFDSDLVPSEAEESFLGGYEREVNPEYYGTVCLPKAGVMTGALLFQVAYMDYKDDGVTPYKVYYDQVANGTMEAGVPYIFLAEQSTIGVYYTATAEETAKDHNGLHGTLVDMVDMSGTGIYMLYNNKVLHSTNSASSLPANRAYLQISEIPGYNNPGYKPQAPKYRRISTNFNGTNSATGIESISDEGLEMKGAQKMLINGKIYILRGEKMYDVTGKVVK